MAGCKEAVEKREMAADLQDEYTLEIYCIRKQFRTALTSSTLGPNPSSILWASSAFFCDTTEKECG